MRTMIYHHFTLLRFGSLHGSETVGGFVMGVPRREFEEFQLRYSLRNSEAVIGAMILPQEWAAIGRHLRVSLLPMPTVQLEPCDLNLPVRRRRATFEGIGGKKFWIEKASNPGFP